MDIQKYVEDLAEKALSGGRTPDGKALEAVEVALKEQVIELWSTASGWLFLVADEEDARLAMKRLGARRGEVYTAAEARRIVSVKDPASVAEIHAWKRRFDAVMREVKFKSPKGQ